MLPKQSILKKITLNKVVNQPVSFDTGSGFIGFHVKREDQNHSYGFGNKYYKLKYNLISALEQQKDTLVTFGGAYSNHLLATAQMGAMQGFNTIGIVRGEELAYRPLNRMLQQATNHGMSLHFVSRETYRDLKTGEISAKIIPDLERAYVIPEGGTNNAGVKGTGELLKSSDSQYEYICSSVGTGGTLSGLINASDPNQKIIGFTALKGKYLETQIHNYTYPKANWQLCTDYHFGGFAKTNLELIEFINGFKEQTGIALDPVYTGKMVYGLIKMKECGLIPKEAPTLAIHTGGLQGFSGVTNLNEASF